MNFDKAYKELLAGKKIRRKSWDKFEHIRFIKGNDQQDDIIQTYKCEYSNFFSNINILLSNGWLVVDGDGKELSFLEALDQLKHKKELTNKEWIKRGIDKFIFVDGNQFAACTAVESSFMPAYACFNANDWEVMS